MEWKVATVSGKEKIVKIPDHFLSGEPVEVVVDACKYHAIFDAKEKSLLLSLHSVNSGFPTSWITCRYVQSSEGASDTPAEVRLEWSGKGQHIPLSAEATVTPYWGALQESGGGGKAAKNVTIKSQITGKVLKVFCSVGQEVKKGDPLLVVEAMKMENKILASITGCVGELFVKEGDPVQTNHKLCTLKPSP